MAKPESVEWGPFTTLLVSAANTACGYLVAMYGIRAAINRGDFMVAVFPLLLGGAAIGAALGLLVWRFRR